ncbi:MAG: hypothetical protein HY855_00210 [Burkholderiales bacterium]|nr:hypothetical protein [Burkholderiales bacterium]
MNRLRSLLREASLIQARQYFGDDGVATADPAPQCRLGQVLERYMAIVILNGEDLRIVFKLHFDPERVAAYRRAMRCRESELAHPQIVDYMKELSNQMGGRVCRILGAQAVAMGMSVPLCTRGIYELYADYDAKIGAIVKFGDLWRLQGAFGELYCSCYIEMPGDADLRHLVCLDEQADEGELDFL